MNEATRVKENEISFGESDQSFVIISFKDLDIDKTGWKHRGIWVIPPEPVEDQFTSCFWRLKPPAIVCSTCARFIWRYRRL